MKIWRFEINYIKNGLTRKQLRHLKSLYDSGMKVAAIKHYRNLVKQKTGEFPSIYDAHDFVRSL